MRSNPKLEGIKDWHDARDEENCIAMLHAHCNPWAGCCEEKGCSGHYLKREIWMECDTCKSGYQDECCHECAGLTDPTYYEGE